MSAGDQKAILALQDLDTTIDRLRHRRFTLPERAELAAAEDQARQLEAQLAHAATVRDEVARRQSEAEENLAATERRSEQVSKRLYGGEVSASRELQAMAADVESLKQRASHLEDQVLELMEEREPLDTRVWEVEAALSALAERRSEVGERLAKAEAAVDEELQAIEAERANVAATVPAGLLDTYERLRARLGGIGAARLVGDHCDGCHLILPATELDRIRHLPAGELVTCDQCGRILVRIPPPAGKLP